MLKYKHYNIKDSDNFNEFDFPNVVSELELLKEGLSHLPDIHKDDILISYLKDHSVKVDWTNDNPKIMETISNGSLITSHLQWLFESCQTHERFTADFEYFIKKSLKESAN
jgi:hypothetical protein